MTSTPVKASLTGLAVNLVLKVVLMGSLAQVGLAMATAVGSWVNLLLVLGFALRAGYLTFDRRFGLSLVKFMVAGAMLAVAFWLTVRVAGGYLAQLSAFRDETMLLVLMIVGIVVYGVTVLALFGRSGLRALIRA